MNFFQKLVATATTGLICSFIAVDAKLAEAAVLTQSTNQVINIANGGDQISYKQVFKQFDPSLGTLEGVNLTIDWNAELNLNIRGCSFPLPFSICDAELLFDNYFYNPGQSQGTLFVDSGIGFVSSNTRNFGYFKTLSFNPSGFVGNSTVVLEGLLLADYIPNPRIPLLAPYSNALTSLTYSPTLTYTYTSVKSVPESSSIWGMAIFGVFGSGLVLKKNLRLFGKS